MRKVYFLTHPEVEIDPEVPVPRWSLSSTGLRRMRSLMGTPWVKGIGSAFSSTEQKALDGARILAEELGLVVSSMEELGENDRSSTGYLPPEAFDSMAQAFFDRPTERVKGWESAQEAQERIVRAIDAVCTRARHEAGDVALVSHGGVGTLLLCALRGWPISRDHDQPGTGGGNYFVFGLEDRRLLQGWKPFES